jgi:hypothetical protein
MVLREDIQHKALIQSAFNTNCIARPTSAHSAHTSALTESKSLYYFKIIDFVRRTHKKKCIKYMKGY